LDKFSKQYHASKALSFARLTSFLYNNNYTDSTRIKSGAMIRVQVESTKRRSEGSGGSRRRLHNKANKNKENIDPQVIPIRKKRKLSKKEHNLGKNILNNRLN
jgi:hypothetical protein